MTITYHTYFKLSRLVFSLTSCRFARLIFLEAKLVLDVRLAQIVRWQEHEPEVCVFRTVTPHSP